MRKRFVFRHFRTRLLAYIVLLVLLQQGLNFFTVTLAANRSAVRASGEALQVTLSSLQYTMAAREGILRKYARLLSYDFAFKALVSENDHGTLISALKSYRKRLDADWMFVVDMNGDVIADSLNPRMTQTPFAHASLIQAAAGSSTNETTSIRIVGAKAYQVVVVPLNGPLPIAWVGIGFEVTDSLAGELEKQTHTLVNLSWRSPSSPPALYSSTLDPAQRADYLAGLPKTGVRGLPHMVTMGGNDYMEIETALYTTPDGVLVAGLEHASKEALAEYHKLRMQMLEVFAVSTLLAAIAALFLAKGVTKPVQRLAHGAARVSAGHYETIGDIGARDELGELAASFDNMTRGLIERDKVRAILGKVVSPAIAAELLSQGIDPSGQELEVSVLFSDIRGFTSLCEGRSPSAILSMLNEYLSTVSDLVDERAGVVDKYIGDAVMALFGAPLGAPDDPQRATETALAMVRSLPAMNLAFARDGWPPLRIGIGIHTGIAVAGNIGSATRLNYTVLGDTVNLAARLEGLCKYYAVPIIVSGHTMQRCSGIVFRELDLVRVKGKQEAVAIFEAVGMQAELDAGMLAALEQHARALAAYRNRSFAQASAAFENGPRDAVAEMYIARCTQHLAAPPAADWDAIENLTEK